jgi:hypothetical protein
VQAETVTTDCPGLHGNENRGKNPNFLAGWGKEIKKA